MSDEGALAHRMIAFQSFYDCDVSSDIELSFLSSWRAIDLKLHAHKVVLAAGSAYFKRELQKPEFQKLEHSQELDNVNSKAVQLKVENAFLDNKVSFEAIKDAIKFMYGFSLPDSDQLEITGLFDAAVEAASRSLASCLRREPKLLDDDPRSDEPVETELQTWFYGVGMYCRSSGIDHAVTPFLMRVFVNNLSQLVEKEEFQELLGRYPQLAVGLLSYMVEEKGGLRDEN